MDELNSPQECALVLVDPQAGLGFAVQSMDRQQLLNNLVALVETARTFDVPTILSTSATKVYSGPPFPAIRELLPDVPVYDRRSMNLWEDDAARQAVIATGRKKLLFAGMLTEACVCFPVLCCLSEGYQAFVVADACGGATVDSHHYALDRMRSKGAEVTSWLQVLLEFQRDWTRKETYDRARGLVERFGGGYGMGLKYARDMLVKP
ncbi:Nicotinamidase-related amidase [Cupriavidus sp. YR651]|uniref:hydrolase n=1 Tax=Cupriavidus sp. YR651 TaxID=1855315 RepID=UPI0008853BC9|nr:hydrolase [Cupriavidus sp. YR651]SDC92429.1 Nicotinamidase-related amidase [Cupriavidus sp. YR651]